MTALKSRNSRHTDGKQGRARMQAHIDSTTNCDNQQTNGKRSQLTASSTSGSRQAGADDPTTQDGSQYGQAAQIAVIAGGFRFVYGK